MEREAFAAYTALLLGFLCRGKPANCKAVLGAPGADDFALVAQILRSFLELHSEAQLLSEEGESRDDGDRRLPELLASGVEPVKRR